MKRKILVPLDGSPFAERVLAFVRHLTKPSVSELLLVHISQPSQFYTVLVSDAIHIADVTHWHDNAQKYLQRKTSELQSEGYDVTPIVSEGDVASNICEVAEAQGVDLIAMTTHGRAGIEKWVLGSVADRVVRGARQPVFLVRPQKEQAPPHTFRRILVPLDGSRLAEKALPKAIELAKANSSEIWGLGHRFGQFQGKSAQRLTGYSWGRLSRPGVWPKR